VLLKLLNANPFLHESAHGKFDHLFALVRFNVSTTDACCVVVSVAKKALAKHTTFDATVVEVEQPVVVPDEASTVTEKLHDCPPKVIANAAVPVDVGVPARVYVRLPAPLANVPATKVAVSPETPVEEIAVPAE
jgi:hypothetical protein